MYKKNTDFNNKWLTYDSQHLIMLIGNKIVGEILSYNFNFRSFVGTPFLKTIFHTFCLSSC